MAAAKAAAARPDQSLARKLARVLRFAREYRRAKKGGLAGRTSARGREATTTLRNFFKKKTIFLLLLHHQTFKYLNILGGPSRKNFNIFLRTVSILGAKFFVRKGEEKEEEEGRMRLERIRATFRALIVPFLLMENEAALGS